MASRLGAQRLIGRRLLDRDGNRIGRIGQVYFDDRTDTPKWVAVRTGLFGANERFVPLQGARATDEGLQVPFRGELIRHGPVLDAGRHLSVAEEERVYWHYGLRPTVPGPREEPGFIRGRHARPAAHDGPEAS
ncbi:sporulation protein YlmC with PRC-barrel domain [Spinactinospora alkalitolerans]|uniref:Sporulation protein YlmC with PRC-barrel domain n=1 Tax=Spinactinospora alkalitolerans TaxID=687207 RepID=A0A852TZ96_9ACTN|nr:PRC-barrel domain-containing protein [Spinactinospora alkalitolerans]NYE49896.1 sporulation protein YlmC with PRC-barrel domain [Spinactinospora alkalitolerans]